MAKNLKGGYKIVSLNGLDLVGESLAIEDLYDKLAKSYDKPILVTGIVIDGEKKKNAFVQVEVLDDGIKINDLYGYDLLVEEDGDITVSANPQELPNTADASAGQVLKLDAQKKPVWGDEAELPDTAEASQGNALLLNEDKEPVWGAISGGTKLYKHTGVLNNTGATPYTLVSTKSTSLVGNRFCDEFNLDSTIYGKISYQGGMDRITFAAESGPNDVIVVALASGVVDAGDSQAGAVGSQCKISTDTVTEL